MRVEEAYKTAIEHYHHDTTLLFQRLNFFFIAMGFLVAAWAQLMGDGTRDLQIIVSVSGFLFSFAFALTNYLNTKIIWNIGAYLRKLEEMTTDEISIDDMPFHRTYGIVKDSLDFKINNIVSLAFEMVASIFRLVFRPKDAGEKNVADHTYFIPLLFTFLWVVLLFCG